ncbi:glycosyltransferase [Conexibacter sp. SYSU D00693]|uniref:glycosyltransferase family 2 protein n=1 Tax=Conexibacter sp. SYSU D00693 TaxID=2812560 RepID=UPI00196B238D|nr:glycosyltransferase [Conexibacter sp. SYSU D00693]
MDVVVLVTAFEEGPRLPATLEALRGAFPGAHVVVADDASTDSTPDAARAGGAELVRAERNLGKGGIATLAAQRLLPLVRVEDPPVVLLCDGDLGASAVELVPLVDAVRRGDADLAVAVFARKVGGGFGVAVGAAHDAILEATGLDLRAPISGQRALRGDALERLLPFAPRFGMEVGMTIDAHRAGLRIAEVELDLAHRATGRTLRGFWHRLRQLRDIRAAARAREGC